MMMMIKNLVAKVALDKPKWLLLVEIPWVSPLKEKQLQHYRWQKPDISWYIGLIYDFEIDIFCCHQRRDNDWYVLFCPSSPPSDHLCRTWPPSLASSLPRSLSGLLFIAIFKVTAIFIIAKVIFIGIFKITTIAIVFTPALMEGESSLVNPLVHQPDNPGLQFQVLLLNFTFLFI